MKDFLKMTTAAAALLGAAAFGAPAAQAAYVGVGVGPVGFDVYSGGYCDRWGCPNDYWTYPIYYGPVFYDNVWYRGPVYSRVVNGERWYWIHGAWHNDQWRGPRPSWARTGHYGEPLGLDYYREHGFRVSDRNWHAWLDRDDRYRIGYRDYDQGGTYGNEEHYPDRYRGNDMDRDRYRDDDNYRYDDRGMTQDRYDYDRDRGTYEHSGYDRDRYYGQSTYSGSTRDRDRYDDHKSDYDGDRDSDRDNGYDRSGYDRDRETYRENGYEHAGYDRDQDRGGYGRSGYESSGGASGTGHATHATSHHAHSSHTHHHTMQPSDHDRSGYQHTGYDRERTHSGDDRMRADDQIRDHGNGGQNDQDRNRTGSENGYEHTNYQPASERGHAKAPPPKTLHPSSQQKPANNLDQDNNGPTQ